MILTITSESYYAECHIYTLYAECRYAKYLHAECLSAMQDTHKRTCEYLTIIIWVGVL
jgi:hypothetical protein